MKDQKLSEQQKQLIIEHVQEKEKLQRSSWLLADLTKINMQLATFKVRLRRADKIETEHCKFMINLLQHNILDIKEEMKEKKSENKKFRFINNG